MQQTTKISEKLEESVHEDGKFELDEDMIPQQLKM